MTVRVLNSELRELGEGPHWIPSRNQLLIVDIDQQSVDIICFATGKVLQKHTFNDKVGAAIPYANNPDLLIVAVGNRLIKYDTIKKEEIETLCDVTEHEKGVTARINDAKCDPQGRIIFGTMPKEIPANYENPLGKLYILLNGEVSVLLEEVGISNGLAWSRDNKTMFYIDSVPARALYAFDYDDGKLSNQRTLVDFKEKPFSEYGFPDGMTIDVQDNLWVAVFGGGVILNIDSRNGKLLDHVKIPSVNTTSACFGGPELNTLLVTSAGKHGVPEGVVEEHGGRVFAVTDLGTKGRLPNDFAG